MTFSKLGKVVKDGIVTEEIVELPKAKRVESVDIVGGTGTGKSTLIESLGNQDMEQNTGLCVIDVKRTSVDRMIARIPDEEREKKVVLLDITDTDFPFGFNLFECPNPKDPLSVHYTVNQAMRIFDRLYEINRGTPQMSYYLRNCSYTIIANPGYTMAEIPLLLTNISFRRKLLVNVSDPATRLFWSEFEKVEKNKLEYVRQVHPILNKLDEFLHPLLLPIIGQKTTINLRQIMDEGKFLLVKLDSRLDDVTTLIGCIIISQILNAAYARPVKKRRQFHVYADEVHRYLTKDFELLFTEGREYQIGTTTSHQNLEQLDEKMRAALLQAGNLIVFHTNLYDAEVMAKAFQLDPRRELVWQPRRVEQFAQSEETYWADPIQEKRYFQLLSEAKEKKSTVDIFSSIFAKCCYVDNLSNIDEYFTEDSKWGLFRWFNPSLSHISPTDPEVQKIVPALPEKKENKDQFFRLTCRPPSLSEKRLEKIINEIFEYRVNTVFEGRVEYDLHEYTSYLLKTGVISEVFEERAKEVFFEERAKEAFFEERAKEAFFEDRAKYDSYHYASYLLKTLKTILQEEYENNPVYQFSFPLYTEEQIKEKEQNQSKLLVEEVKESIFEIKMLLAAGVVVCVLIFVIFFVFFGLMAGMSLFILVPGVYLLTEAWKELPEKRNIKLDNVWAFRKHFKKYYSASELSVETGEMKWKMETERHNKNLDDEWAGSSRQFWKGGIEGSSRVSIHYGFWRLHELPRLAEWLQYELQKVRVVTQALQEEIRELESQAEVIKATYWKTRIKRISLGYFLEKSHSETHATRAGSRFYSEGDSTTVHYKEWVLEPGPPEPLANTEKRVKDDIIRLNDYQAKARIKVATNEKDKKGKPVYIIGEYTFKTIEPEPGIWEKDFDERIARIQTQNRTSATGTPYCRPLFLRTQMGPTLRMKRDPALTK